MSLGLAWRFGSSRPRAVPFAVALMLLASSAHATKPVEKVHIEYSASATCPRDEHFIAALRRDADAFELVGADEARRLVDVDLRAGAGRAHGQFRLVDRALATTIDRELTGPDCEAVGRALALMLALAMHRLSSTETSETPTKASSNDVERATAAHPMDPADRPRAVPPPSAPAVAPSRKSLDVSVDAQVELTRAVIAEVLPFGALMLHFEPRGWQLRPSVAIGIRQSLPHDIAISGGETRFLSTAGALRLCPHAFVFGPFELAPCIEGALGFVRAEAVGLPSSRTSTRAWRAASAVLEARWHISNRWFATGTGFLTAPLTRSRFELSSGALISQAPPVGGGAGLGIGLSL